MKSIFFFDLDGTLTDPMEGITKSVQKALRHFGIEAEDRQALRCYIGPPLREQFMAHAGLTAAQAEEAVAVYRSYFGPIGLFENTVYPGIPQMLEALKRAGKTLCVASSKPKVYVDQILAHFELTDFFSIVEGSTLDGSREKKSDIVAAALRRLSGTPKESICMVGDREHDVYGAAEQGLDCVGVTYGYGSEAELRQAGARWVARDVCELEKLLLEI